MTGSELGAAAAWAARGGLALTGRAGGPPLPPPAALLTELVRLGAAFGEHAARRESSVVIDPFQVVVDRAAIANLQRAGAISCGGGSHLLPVADGWVAVSLVRTEDRELIPAWLECAPPEPGTEWIGVSREIRNRPVAEVVARARLLGLPVAALGEIDARGSPRVIVTAAGSAGRRSRAVPLVVDLSSLWAGPLCSNILMHLGARVIKVESNERPDGARSGPRAFFDLVNRGKENVTFDFASPDDLDRLRRLLVSADVVVESSRPRSLEHLGVFASDILANGPKVWASITGYGRSAPSRDWVAFGDDAAVAGGLVAWDDTGPCFCADAIADPLTGMTAAVAILDSLVGDDAVLIDVALARVAAHCAGTPNKIGTPAEVAKRQ